MQTSRQALAINLKDKIDNYEIDLSSEQTEAPTDSNNRVRKLLGIKGSKALYKGIDLSKDIATHKRKKFIDQLLQILDDEDSDWHQDPDTRSTNPTDPKNTITLDILLKKIGGAAAFKSEHSPI